MLATGAKEKFVTLTSYEEISSGPLVSGSGGPQDMMRVLSESPGEIADRSVTGPGSSSTTITV